MILVKIEVMDNWLHLGKVKTQRLLDEIAHFKVKK